MSGFYNRTPTKYTEVRTVAIADREWVSFVCLKATLCYDVILDHEVPLNDTTSFIFLTTYRVPINRLSHLLIQPIPVCCSVLTTFLNYLLFFIFSFSFK